MEIQKIIHFLIEKGFNIEAHEPIQSNEKITHLQRKGKSMGGLLGFSDHFFVYEISHPQLENVKTLHEMFRQIVNKRIKTPKALRLHVPNIVSIILIDEEPEGELLEYIRSLQRPISGGEDHSIFIIRKNTFEIFSRLPNAYIIGGTAGLLTMSMKKTDPFNRAFYCLQELLIKRHSDSHKAKY